MRVEKSYVVISNNKGNYGDNRLNIKRLSKQVIRVLVVLGVLAYTFVSRAPVDAMINF